MSNPVLAFAGALQKADAFLTNATPGIPRDLAQVLATAQGADVLRLAAKAHEVQQRWVPQFDVCSILNAKSGACTENCRFCAQSSHHSAEIETYALMPQKEILAAAEKVYAQGVRRFGLVTSGLGFYKRSADFETLLESARALRAEFPGLAVCGSFGCLSADNAFALAAAGITYYNINLQTAPEQYPRLVADTHRIEERMATIRHLQAAGIGICSGGIIGLGESMADRLDLAFALASLKVHVVPLNVLIPITGTPLVGEPAVPIQTIIKTFALFRLIMPRVTLKFAAGRETRLKDFQGLLMLSGMNSFLTGGYLTTRGRSPEEDRDLQRQLEEFAR
jgi:biotin synthase